MRRVTIRLDAGDAHELKGAARKCETTLSGMAREFVRRGVTTRTAGGSAWMVHEGRGRGSH